MNAIMNYNGAVTPYFWFQTTSGFTISTLNNTQIAFKSFSQQRTVKKAAVFEVTFDYFPRTFSPFDSLYVHNALLNSTGQMVNYKYGYSTNSGIMPQEAEYIGQFTNYKETFNDTYITYTISGIGAAIDGSSSGCSIQAYLEKLKKEGTKVAPSEVLSALISGEDSNKVISDYFKDIDYSDISHEDAKIDPSEISVNDGTVHDIIFGSYANDNNVYGGLVSYSFIKPASIGDLSVGLASVIQSAKQGGVPIPFIAYFDNIKKGSKKASFHYKPLINGEDAGTQFMYRYGNSEKHSDVLSVSISYDCAVAIATAACTQTINAGVDANGNQIGSNLAVLQAQGFTKDAFVEFSKISMDNRLTSTELAKALNFPFEMQITVVGQLNVNNLMDTVNVVILINGSECSPMSGNFKVMEVVDNIDSGGFQTTLTLFKQTEVPATGSAGLVETIKETGNIELAEQTQKALNRANKWSQYM